MNTLLIGIWTNSIFNKNTFTIMMGLTKVTTYVKFLQEKLNGSELMERGSSQV